MSVPEAVEELIGGARVSAHVATAVEDRPHVAPVWYLYEDGVVSFVTGGTKLRNLRANPRVALSIERATEQRVYWTVTLLGTATVVEDRDRVEQARERIFAKYGAADQADDYGFQPLVRVAVRTATHETY